MKGHPIKCITSASKPTADPHALGHLLIDPIYCAQEKHDGKRLMLWKHGNVVEGINRKGLTVSVPKNIAREAMRPPTACLYAARR